MRRSALLPLVACAALAVQGGYLGYAMLKPETEIFVHRPDGSISSLLAHNEYGSFNSGYRLYRLFRDYCRGCSVEVSGLEAFSAGQLAEIGKVEVRRGGGAACPSPVEVAAARPGARRFDVKTDETPFGMFKAGDAKVWGLPVTVVLEGHVKVYRACRQDGRDAILPTGGGSPLK